VGVVDLRAGALLPGLFFERSALLDREKNVNVGEIVVPANRLRAYRDPSELASSIDEMGLLQPIIVTRSGRLVAGRHRLEAVKMLGWDTVPAYVVEDDGEGEHRTRVMEIDENLKRHELTELERDAHYSERERLMGFAGERARAGDNQYGGTAKLAVPKTTRDIATEHGESERSYYRRKFIGGRIPDDLREDILDAYYQPGAGCGLADNQRQLNYLAGVDDPDDQREIARRVLDGNARDVFKASEALKRERGEETGREAAKTGGPGPPKRETSDGGPPIGELFEKAGVSMDDAPRRSEEEKALYPTWQAVLHVANPMTERLADAIPEAKQIGELEADARTARHRLDALIANLETKNKNRLRAVE
jgi:hypothetical protein